MNGSQVKQLAAAEVQLSRGGDNWWGEAYDYFMKFYTAIYLYKLIVAGWFFFFSPSDSPVCAPITRIFHEGNRRVCVCVRGRPPNVDVQVIGRLMLKYSATCQSQLGEEAADCEQLCRTKEREI